MHVPKHGTVKAIRLEAPSADLFRRVVEARLRPCLDELPEGEPVADIFPFTDEQVQRIARTEPTLRDMLQQFRHLFDHLVYGPDDQAAGECRGVSPTSEEQRRPDGPRLIEEQPEARITPADIPELPPVPEAEPTSRVAALLGRDEEPPAAEFKKVEIIEAPADDVPMATPISNQESGVRSQESVKPEMPVSYLTPDSRLPAPEQAVEVPPRRPFPAAVVSTEPPADVVTPPPLPSLGELWDQEQRAARRKLEPEGALTGATRELQAGLGAFLGICHEHGVKVGPWRLQHVVTEYTFGDHPTYGAVTIAHWACKDGQPWKVGIGLFLARGAGKPKDLEVKLGVLEIQPAMVDVLILLRPEDDLGMTGKSKTLLQEAERKGKHTRLEPVSLDGLAQLYSFPRWLAAVRESLPEGTPLPNLADIIQEKCEKLLEQVCMPVQG